MKKYKSIDELISEILSKRIKIKKTTVEKLKYILTFENYFNLITGYREPFVIKTENSKEVLKNTDVSEIISLYNFDRNLRYIYLKYILIIESRLKTVISSEFSKTYKNHTAPYLNAENFIGDKKKIQFLISKIKDQSKIKIKQNEPNYIKHYIEKYNDIPFWVLINCLSFGTVNVFYEYLNPELQQSIATYFNIPADVCKRFINHLSLYRNICAHNERFYCVKTNFRIPNKAFAKYYDTIFKISKTDGIYVKGTNDIFALTMIILIISEETHRKEFLCSLLKEIKMLKNNLKTIDVYNILNIMGFPKTWNKITSININKKRNRKNTKINIIDKLKNFLSSLYH